MNAAHLDKARGLRHLKLHLSQEHALTSVGASKDTNDSEEETGKG
jgi:hypothetical protein